MLQKCPRLQKFPTFITIGLQKVPFLVTKVPILYMVLFLLLLISLFPSLPLFLPLSKTLTEFFCKFCTLDILESEIIQLFIGW